MAIIIIATSVSQVSADHYSVSVTTDNTTWTIDRTTLPVTFEMSGTVTGYGSMVLDHDINLAGVIKKGLTYSHPGEIAISENLDVKSTAGPVNITATVQGDNATVKINESWPTSLIDETDLSYEGKGILSKESYGNNYDVVCSRFIATKLEKTSKCNATLTKTVISAVIKPGNVTENLGFVKGTDYQLKVTSDKYAHLGYKSTQNKKQLLLGSESYYGNFGIETSVGMTGIEDEGLEEESEEWLSCPSGDP